MKDPAFFGYGSLVNVATHHYHKPTVATLPGWRREWQHTYQRDVAFLSVKPCPDTTIEGLVATVPGANWAALDQRERTYLRRDVTQDLGARQRTAIYQVDPGQLTGRHGLILLSYLDVVIQGYLRQFGEDGVERFFATTDGWDTPIVNDRAEPRYPRAQTLRPDETELVDHHLAAQLEHLKQA